MVHLVELIKQYGLAFVFLNVLLETSGLPVPAYPTLLVAAALASQGDYSIVQILLVALSASLIADLGWYWAGTRYGRRILQTLCRVSLSPDYCVRQTESIFTRWGSVSLMFAKFIPGFSTLGTALAGTAATPIPIFLFFDAIGALAWSGVAITLGRVFREAINDVLEVLEDFGRWGVIVLLCGLCLYLLTKWWQRYRFIRQLRMDRITVDELQQLIVASRAPVVLDVRSHAHRTADGIIPGSLSASLAELASLSSQLSLDDEVVVYCACPNEASAAQVAKALKQLGYKRVRPLLGGIDAWIAAGYPIVAFEQ